MFADRWLLTEQGCARQGLPTAVRGAAAPVEELQYIYDHSDAKAVVLQVGGWAGGCWIVLGGA